MFPDPTIKWRPYPSMLDGINRPPAVLDHGLWGGTILNLVVIECSTTWKPGSRAYRIELNCELYAAIDEMIYSIANHGDSKGSYDGGVYIKEASHSALLRHYAEQDPFRRTVRHFLFVGADKCYETLGTAEPVIRPFESIDAALAWRLPARDGAK